MSIALPDIFGMEVPKQGIIPPSVYVEVKLADSVRVIDILALPEQRIDYVKRRVISRLYGDIAQDFESFLDAAFPDGLPPLDAEAAHLLKSVRQKLAGDGPGRSTHQAPVPQRPFSD